MGKESTLLSPAPVPVVQHGGVHSLGRHGEERQQTLLPTLQGFLWEWEELRGVTKSTGRALAVFKGVRHLSITDLALSFVCQILQYPLALSQSSSS